MSDATAAPPPGAEPAGTCPKCGAPLAAGSDWCLSCGHAVNTTVAGAPGWRTPIAIVGFILLLAAVGLVIAFLQLSDDADTVAGAPAPTPSETTVAPTGPSGPSGPTGPSGTTGPSGPTGTEPTPTATPEPTATPVAGGLAEWPADTTAFTVIIYSGETRALAEAKARSLTGLSDLGLLRSGDYASLRAGYWVVFSGQYDTIEAATDAADALQEQAPGAYPRRVMPR